CKSALAAVDTDRDRGHSGTAGGHVAVAGTQTCAGRMAGDRARAAALLCIAGSTESGTQPGAQHLATGTIGWFVAAVRDATRAGGGAVFGRGESRRGGS